MLPLCIARPQESLFGGADWTSLGLVSCIIGAFLIANSTLFEHPRSLVGRYFGRSMGRLQSVREYVYNRVQTTLGFAFLLAGFGFQLIGRFHEVGPEGPVATEPPLSMAWVGVIVASAIVLLFSGWWWSVWAFRRYVREYFTDHPRDFMAEPAVAREVGELFGIESSEDDTVEDYVKRQQGARGWRQRRPRRYASRRRRIRWRGGPSRRLRVVPGEGACWLRNQVLSRASIPMGSCEGEWEGGRFKVRRRRW